MSVACRARQLAPARRLLGVRELRTRKAELEIASAQLEVHNRAERLAAAEDGCARAKARRAELDGWFRTTARARHLECALARGEALLVEQACADAARTQAQQDLETAERGYREAASRLARTRAKADTAATRVAAGRRARDQLREFREEDEQGDAGPRSRGGFAAP